MSNVIKAIREIYPDIKEGVCYWESKQDGSPLTNPIDGLRWENAEHPKPTWADIEVKLAGINLQEAKNTKLIQIKANRKQSTYLPVEYNGSTFTNSEVAGNNLQAADKYSEEPINWLDIDGNPVILSKIDIGNIVRLMMNTRSLGYFKEAQLKASIKACTTLAEVEAINITFE
jgi:hypothetical protein